MKIEIELSDKQIQELEHDINRLGYKAVDRELFVKQIIDDLFSSPLVEMMGYDASGLGESDETEDLEEWGVEQIAADTEDYDDEEE